MRSMLVDNGSISREEESVRADGKQKEETP